MENSLFASGRDHTMIRFSTSSPFNQRLSASMIKVSETFWHLSAISSMLSITSFTSKTSFTLEILSKVTIVAVLYFVSISRSISCVSWANSIAFVISVLSMRLASIPNLLKNGKYAVEMLALDWWKA